MKTIPTLEQWLDAATPFVFAQVEATYQSDLDFETGLHGLLLAMPDHVKAQCPVYAKARARWEGRTADPVAWCPEAITEHAVLPWLRSTISDGDLDGLALCTALAVPKYVSNELCKKVLYRVEQILHWWETTNVEEYTATKATKATGAGRPKFYPMLVIGGDS